MLNRDRARHTAEITVNTTGVANGADPASRVAVLLFNRHHFPGPLSSLRLKQ
jgi:hypothetical protein